MKKYINYITVYLLGVSTAAIFVLFFISDIQNFYEDELHERTWHEIKRKDAMIAKLDTIKSISYVAVRPDTFKADYYKGKGYKPKDGFIPNEYVASQVGIQIAKGMYGNRVLEAMPLRMTLDKNNVWHLEGHLSDLPLGGSFYIELDKKTGKVLKIFHK